MGYILDVLNTNRPFLPSCTLPLCVKNNGKNPLNYFSEKVKQFQANSFKNERAREKTRGGGSLKVNALNRCEFPPMWFFYLCVEFSLFSPLSVKHKSTSHLHMETTIEKSIYNLIKKHFGHS